MKEAEKGGSRPKFWKCSKCGVVLGTLIEGSVLRIKTGRGGIIDFVGGQIVYVCDRCTSPNIMIDDKFAKDNGLEQPEITLEDIIADYDPTGNAEKHKKR